MLVVLPFRNSALTYEPFHRDELFIAGVLLKAALFPLESGIGVAGNLGEVRHDVVARCGEGEGEGGRAQ